MVRSELVEWTERAVSERRASLDDGERITQCADLVEAGEDTADAALRRQALEATLNSAYGVGDPRCVGEFHMALGRLAAQEYSKDALDHYAAASFVASRAGHVDTWVAAELDRATFYYRIGRFEEALQLIDGRLPWLGILDSSEARLEREAATLTVRGRLLEILGRYGEGIEAMERALEIRRLLELGRPPQTRSFLLPGINALGRAHLNAGRIEKAEPLIRQAVELARGTSDEAVTLNELVDLYLAKGDYGAARETLDHADALRLDIKPWDANHRLNALYLRARLNAASGDVEAAVRSAEALAASLEIFRTRGGTGLTAPFFEKRRFYTDYVVRLLLESGRVEEAFDAAERIRARGLLDAILWPPEDVFQSVDPDAARRAQTLRERMAKLANDGGSSNEIVSVREALLRLEAKVRTASGAFAAEPVTLNRTRRLFSPGDLLLTYWMGEERTELWVLLGGSQELRHVVLGPTGPIASSVEELRTLFEEEQSERPAARRSLAALGGKLLGPVERELNASTNVVVVADGVLSALPFSVLPRADGRPLVRTHSVANVHSLSVLAAIRSRRESRPRHTEPVLTAFVGPRYGEKVSASMPSLPSAPTTARDLTSIAERAGGHARIFQGIQASRESFLGATAARSDFLHLGAHATLHPSFPDLSALHMSTVDERGEPVEGEIRLADLDQIDLSARLVTLAGCETARGVVRPGEGPMALPRGFLHAGADAVVASLWRVRDSPTAELMVRLYEGLLERGDSPAEALRAAQIELLDGDWPATEAWGGFILLGDWAPAGALPAEPFSTSGVLPIQER